MKTILLLQRGLCLFFCSVFCIGATPLYTEDYSHLIHIGEQRFATEIADTPEKMQLGMMYRPKMADNQAMLFAYSSPQQASFWMKNTLISLDMLFFDENGNLVEIKHNIPPCKTTTCPIYRSESHAIQYIVELQGGISERLAIQVGEQLSLIEP